MRELVKLFGSPETTDDLGMGQLRDAISNSLFPGTSVLHLGARYMLLVPWSYQTAAHGTRNPDELRRRSEESERLLIGRLRELGEESYIGRDAGRNVQQLPSAAYWTALRRFGIVHPDMDRAAIAQAMCADFHTPEEGEEANYLWHPTLPQPPGGFPKTEENGLTLAQDEARWLQERILTSCPGTLLAHLLECPTSPNPGLWAPWLDPACRQAEDQTAEWLKDAEAFSFIHHGANILYQRLLAERSVTAFGGGEANVDRTGELLETWETERESKMPLLEGWDVEGFLARALQVNRSVNTSTANFARIMADAATRHTKLSDNQELRTAVETREKLMKKANSRFRNERRLRVWEAPTRVGALTFRWSQVRRSILDIHAGLKAEG